MLEIIVGRLLGPIGDDPKDLRRRSDAAKIVRFVLDHIDRPISVDEVVHHLHGRRRSIERWCRRATDRTVHQVIAFCRIETAKRLLAQSDRAIIDVAGDVGFSGPSRFSTCFKKHVGVSPREFRRRLRDGRSHERSADGRLAPRQAEENFRQLSPLSQTEKKRSAAQITMDGVE